jgi:hypothetical protein
MGNRAHLKGINIIGMKRQGYSKQEISEVVDFLRTIESSNLSPRAFVEHPELMVEYKDNRVIAEMVEQIRKGDGARFFAPEKQEWAPAADFDLCLSLNRFNFVLKVEQENGVNYLRKITT